MEYLKIYEHYNDLEAELAKYRIYNYTINNDNTIDVNGNVYLGNRNLIQIPLQFGKVDGNFNCQNNQLTSLEYAPKYVGGYFTCYNNKLTSLEGSPKYVGGDFNCNNNNIIYIPPDLDIEGNIYIAGNPIDIVFYNIITTNKQILEELDIYNPISKDGSTIYRTKLKEMYKQLGILNEFDSDIIKLARYYKIV